MKLTINVDPLVIELFISRKYDEAANECMCNDCHIVRALVHSVLELEEKVSNEEN